MGKVSRPPHERKVTIVSRLFALGASGFAFVATVGALFTFSGSALANIFVAAMSSAVIAALFARSYPAHGWRWGLWASAAFVVFCVVVVASYLSVDRSPWHPIVTGLVIVLLSCAAAALSAGTREARALRSTST